jgi:dihydroxyacetone kinase DhaKLM complex PTS-EIIA-like component DhaM
MEMAAEANIVPIGGTKAGTLGSDFDRTFEAMDKAARAGEVVVIADLGSAKSTGEMAQEALDPELQSRVFLSDAALVEGAISAAVSIAGGLSAERVLAELEDYRLEK